MQKRFAASLLVSLSVLCTFGLRSTGRLEFLELAAYDGCIRWRPQASAPSSRIVLITVTEGDIHHYGWPVTDATLARALERLTQYRPRAIGLDIYRDMSVSLGREALEAILTRNRHIIAPVKFGNGVEIGIPPPSVLAGTDQVGFVDTLVDPDGMVRRGLLFLDNGKTTAYSLALRLALAYLQAEGILPQADESDPQYIRLGQTTLRRFQSNDGGYVGADDRGYQFLLDFKEAPGAFPFFSLTTLLSGKIDPKAIEGKIVLIGVTAESVKDLFYTPHSRGLQAGQQTRGVELHAHVASQLLRAALEGAAPVATPSEWLEGLWILIWGAMGGAVGLGVQSPWGLLLLAAGGPLILGLVAYLAFLYGWWIPLASPAMAWLISILVITVYMRDYLRKLIPPLSPPWFPRHTRQILDQFWDLLRRRP